LGRDVQFIIMHKTSAHWEAGAIPSKELIARVGALLGELAKAHLLLGGEGLRPSSEGVRLTFSGGTRTISVGPFKTENELPSGFSILRVPSIDEAIEWASRQAAVLGDVEIDIRPVTEPWDIGMTRKPENVTTRRYMALRKATAASEAGAELSATRRTAMECLVHETAQSGIHVATVTMRPSAKGRRYKNTREGIRMTDGPFTESKELIAGYVMISAESLDDAGKWAERYLQTVEADEVEVRELENG
jgi:hypothetical protein